MAKLEQAAKMSLKALRAEVRGLDRDQEKAERSGRRMHSSAHRGYRRQKQDVEALRRATLAQTDAITRQGREAMTLGGRFRRMRSEFTSAMTAAAPYLAGASMVGGAILRGSMNRMEQKRDAASTRLSAGADAEARMLQLFVGDREGATRAMAIRNELRAQYGMSKNSASNAVFNMQSMGLLQNYRTLASFGKLGMDPTAISQSVGGLLGEYGMLPSQGGTNEQRTQALNMLSAAALESSADPQQLMEGISRIGVYLRPQGTGLEEAAAIGGQIKQGRIENRLTQIKAFANKAAKEGLNRGLVDAAMRISARGLSEPELRTLLPEEAYGGYQFVLQNLSKISQMRTSTLPNARADMIQRQIQTVMNMSPHAQATWQKRLQEERAKLVEEETQGGLGLRKDTAEAVESQALDMYGNQLPTAPGGGSGLDILLNIPGVREWLIDKATDTLWTVAPETTDRMTGGSGADASADTANLQRIADILEAGGGRPE